MFRSLEAGDVKCRAAMCREDGVQLLLYKDARCDARILDESVGPMRWQCSYESIDGVVYCTVSIKDESGEWVSKSDCGVESNMEKEKGQASDAFKRACSKWGIGRELYAVPFIRVPKGKCRISKGRNGNLACKDRFIVSDMEVSNGKVAKLVIANEKTGQTVFDWHGEAHGLSALDEAKQRLWVAIKAYADMKSMDPNKIADDIAKRSDFEQTVEFYERIAQEFEDAASE